MGFITIFPIEQGYSFSPSDNSSYLTVSNSNLNTQSQLNNISSSTSSGLNQWNIEVGFMGSNTLKQSSTGISTYATSIFSELSTLAILLFGLNSPVSYVITILTILTGAYIVYLIIAFVRSGR